MQINPNDLSGEWLEQASVYQEVAEMTADAKKEIDDLKDAISSREATLDQQIRTDPIGYGIPKVTDKAVICRIELDDGLAEMRKKLNQAVHTHNMLTGALTALNHRKHALENLVQLTVTGIYAEPKKGKQTVKEMVEAKAQDRLKSKARKRS